MILQCPLHASKMNLKKLIWSVVTKYDQMLHGEQIKNTEQISSL